MRNSTPSPQTLAATMSLYIVRYGYGLGSASSRLAYISRIDEQTSFFVFGDGTKHGGSDAEVASALHVDSALIKKKTYLKVIRRDLVALKIVIGKEEDSFNMLLNVRVLATRACRPMMPSSRTDPPNYCHRSRSTKRCWRKSL